MQDMEVKAAIVEDKQPNKIGGWLILLGLGITLSPFSLFNSTVQGYKDVFSGGIWDALTTQSSEFYSPFWGPFIISEIVLNFLLVMVSLYLAVLFYGKKQIFPKWFAGISVFTAVLILCDGLAVNYLMPGTPILGKENGIEFVKTLIACFIWTPYLYFSDRAVNTFIR